MGTPGSPGTVIVTVVGDVRAAGCSRSSCGTPLRDVLDACGGPQPGRQLVAAFSGVSNPVLTAADFDVPLTYEDMEASGTGLGAAGFVVYDDTADMVSVARELQPVPGRRVVRSVPGVQDRVHGDHRPAARDRAGRRHRRRPRARSTLGCAP